MPPSAFLVVKFLGVRIKKDAQTDYIAEDLPAATHVPGLGFEENRIPIWVRSGKVQIGVRTVVEPQRISQH